MAKPFRHVGLRLLPIHTFRILKRASHVSDYLVRSSAPLFGGAIRGDLPTPGVWLLCFNYMSKCLTSPQNEEKLITGFSLNLYVQVLCYVLA